MSYRSDSSDSAVGVIGFEAGRQLAAVSAFLFLLTGLLLPARAEIMFPELPPRGEYVVDAAALLSPDDRDALNAVATVLMMDEEVPLIVVTITSMVDYGAVSLSIEDYARRLFDHWGIGSQARNYGMLVLVARDDRRARIEFGAGFANRYNDEAEIIMQDLMLPAFKRGAFGAGLVDAAYALDSLARGLGLPRTRIDPITYAPLALLGGVALIMLIVNLFRSGRKGWAWFLIGIVGIVLFFILRTLLRGGGRSGAFGGGSGGGGGASGGW